ncbi:HTH-type transcriptional repressor FabR [Mycobacteroides salmoniphilum]|uniref:DNA-binding transcriptional repressor AcrR n=1 Tax=Mycobacteroides salmoniphilum TaxID=404941 RepID=A0A4R8SVW0_9MYCO|nr:HTH-type transcriptional repressor FabR [Mycobacteroides salmoniphilum]TDZ99110.1 DNA-binding transcriptional repressor AcrR [Mycobacteroides salmoniphilum]TEA06467.1 DNA-binding transcriptional repressor AcrR [Mycobacteroides salmoniphilum]
MQPDGPELPAGRWNGQRERRRAEFVEAALAAIAEHGPQTSTEQIAVYVGVTRTKLYRHFSDAADLQRAVAQRASDMIIAELEPVWQPLGSMAQIIDAGIGAYVRFLVGHRNLYRYLARCSLSEGSDTPDAIADIKMSTGQHLSRVFAVYLEAFGIDTDTELLAMGIVGMAETSVSYWLDQPGEISQERLIESLVRRIWLIVEDNLRAGGVYLDSQEPLPEPGEIARNAQRYRDPARLP